MLIYYFNDFDAVQEDIVESLIQKLPAQQTELVRSIKSPAHRCEQVVGYLMLILALQRQMSAIRRRTITIKQVPHSSFFLSHTAVPHWGFGEHGKPYLTNYPDIHFNISHCDKAIAVAVSNHEVGIDVEGRRRFNESLLQRAMNDEEQAAIHKSSDPEMEFAKLWTRKEAYFKWTGTGILLDHLKSAEADAKEAGCIVKSRLITPEFGNDSFYLSVAEKEDE